MKKIPLKPLLTLIAVLTACIAAFAQADEYTAGQQERSKTFLIIDSYSEMAPWARSVITPITYYMANDDNVHAELYHLNSVLITDSIQYNQVYEEFFNRFGNKKIDYVAFIGQLAFTFRDEIKRRWGDDIPMLLITRDLTIAPTDFYFSGFENDTHTSWQRTISDLRNEYNFTTIYVPNYYKETIDLMNSVLGGMDRLLLFADAAYYNRALDLNIQTYLAENYPNVEYELVKANPNDNYKLQYYLMHPSEHTGLLLSSWFYEKTGPFGYPILISGDINLLSSSVNPMFALRHAFMENGAIGGAYYDPELLDQNITSSVERIVNGEQPRDMKFTSDGNNVTMMIDYNLLKKNDLSEKNCPPGTVIVGKPVPVWKKYIWTFISMILVVMVGFLFMWRRNVMQRNEIEMLSRHKKFIDYMPVPYSKARIQYTPEMKVANIAYTLYNQAFEDLMNTNRRPDTSYILFPNDFISQKTTELLTTNRPVSFIHHFPHTDKYIIFTLCLVEAKRKNSVDIVESIDIFANDITERQKNERNLRETSKRLDLTINIANIVPWEWDMASDIMYVKAPDLFKSHNNTFSSDPEKAQWSALPTSEFMRMIVSEDKEEMRHAREQVILNKISEFHIEYRIKVNRQGKEVIEWFDVSGAVSERDDAGKPLKVIGTLMVVTDRKRQENALIEAEEKARQSDKMKSAFLANMSHEIRTPLNAIVGFSNLMAETDEPEKRREYASLINKNNDLLLNLVNDVLDLAKIESNTLDINKTPTDLNDLMRTAGESIKGKVKPGVTLNMTVSEPQCYVNIDPNRVIQVMLNLLNNATKFTSSGSITYGYDLVGKELHFFVKDTGIGISQENQERLFKRFDRLNSNVQGTGLGLSICKHLVEHMGGHVGIESKGEGFGSTFWFNMPYEPVDESTMGIDPQAPAQASTVLVAPEPSAAPAAKSPDSDGRKRILIAEDIEGNYLLLKSFLGKKYILDHAWDGEEAVELYRRNRPDLILMDISMPKMNGYQATEHIRRTDKKIPIIAVTAYAYATDRKRILSSGFDGYLAKPLSRSELHNAIESRLGTA